jgi:hypothetical protein
MTLKKKKINILITLKKKKIIILMTLQSSLKKINSIYIDATPSELSISSMIAHNDDPTQSLLQLNIPLRQIEHNEEILHEDPDQPIQHENPQIEHLLPADLIQEVDFHPQDNLNLQVGFMRHQNSRMIDPVFESFTMPLGTSQPSVAQYVTTVPFIVRSAASAGNVFVLVVARLRVWCERVN